MKEVKIDISLNQSTQSIIEEIKKECKI